MVRAAHLAPFVPFVPFVLSAALAPLPAQAPFVLRDAAGATTRHADLPAALAAVAARRATGEKGDLTVVVPDGVHALAAPLAIGPEHTSPVGALRLSAAPGAHPVLSGGTRLSFTAATENGRTVWIAEAGAAAAQVRELWIDGARRTLARHPDEGTFAVVDVPGAGAEWTQGDHGFRFAPGQLTETAVGADVVVMDRWVESHLSVAAVDPAAATFTSSKRSVFRLQPKDPWYAEGALVFLDRPGEFHVDRATGRIRYLPRPGEDPAKVAAYVPRLSQLLVLQGDPAHGRFVEHVSFAGLSFAHAEWWFPADFRSNWPAPDAGGFSQAAILVPAAIAATGARDCSFTDCEFAHLGGYAVELGRGCTGNVLDHCRIHDLGGGGVKIGETAIPQGADATSDNTVRDCEVGDGGHLFHSAVGVWIGQSPRNTLEHDEIHDFLYTGISVGWTWGYGPAGARDERIEHNHVHHIGARANGEGPWLADMGGIYTLGTQPGTRIRGNHFHDIAAFGYGGWGIYFDEGTSEVVASGNLVARTTHGGFHQHYGKDNVFEGNVLLDGRDAQIQRTRVEAHSSFTFRKNLVAWTAGELFAGDLKGRKCTFEQNLYWRASGPEIGFAGGTFAEWQASGMDAGSRIAEPGFVDPANGDWRTKEGGAARAMGIEGVDVRGAGVRAR